jgi:gliding motility-associated lipoprotein GldH
MKTKSKVLSFCLLVWASLLFSCSNNRVFEEFRSFSGESWALQDTISFELNLEAKDHGKTLIGVRFNETYPYSNLYVNFWMMDSAGSVIDSKLLNIPLFDSKSGIPFGKGFGDTFTKYDTLRFELDERVKKVSVLQYMRSEEVAGLEAIGLKILKK